MSNESEYYVRQTCPFCEQPSAAAAPYMSSTPRAEDLPFTEHQAIYSGFTNKRSFFTYYRCPACQGLFCRTYFTTEQLQQLYAHEAENMAEVPLICRARTQEIYFHILQQYSNLTGQILELGPDIGLFTRCCVAHGQFEKFWLYEPNVEVHAALRKNLGASEFFLTAQNYSAADMPPQSLSTAVLIHVLDHIWNLDSLLRDLQRSLKPGATILLVTHDEASGLARLLGRRWSPFALCHPQLFSAASTRAALQRHGFAAVKTVKCANVFPIGYLAKTALTMLGLCSSNRLSLDTPKISIRLGNIATFATRI